MDEAFTMNPECYQAQPFAAVERKRVFGRSWVAVGKVDDMRHPGDTITATVGGQPVFVARDKHGRLNGFRNVCRHRGSKLILQDGRYPVISCPYHRWGYSLEGKLLATPLWNTVEGGQKVDMKTGEKKAARPKRVKKYKKGERLKELQETIAADIALIEEAEALAVAPPAAADAADADNAADAAADPACDQMKSIREVFDTKHLKDFDKEAFRLFSVRAEEWGPLIFVCLDDDDYDARVSKKRLSDVAREAAVADARESAGVAPAEARISNRAPGGGDSARSNKVPLAREASHGFATPDLRTCLGGVVPELADYPLSELVSVRSSEERPQANWKLLQENFMEYYHLPSVHPNLCAVSGVDEHKRRQGRGQYIGFVTEPLTRGGTPIDPGVLPDFPGLDAAQRDTAVFHSLFPNVFYFLLPSHMFMVRLEPISPTETREVADLLVHPTLLDDGAAVDEATGETLGRDEIERRLDAMWEFYLETNREDIVACEHVQEGVSSEPYQGGRMSFRFEETIHRFQNMVADHMVGEPRVPCGDDMVIGGYNWWEAEEQAKSSGTTLDV